jgi:hypothetical protein
MKEKNLPSAEDLATQNEQLRNELKFMKTEKRVTELLGRNPGEDFINDVIDYIYHNNLNPDSFFEIAKKFVNNSKDSSLWWPIQLNSPGTGAIPNGIATPYNPVLPSVTYSCTSEHTKTRTGNTPTSMNSCGYSNHC